MNGLAGGVCGNPDAVDRAALEDLCLVSNGPRSRKVNRVIWGPSFDPTVSFPRGRPSRVAHPLRPCAAWNLMLAAYHLDARQARSFLRFMSYYGLRCRRQISKRVKKTVPACMICWAEGYLSGLVGYQPHAIRCLSWAAIALFDLGAVREATLCALDLVTFEPGGFGKVHQIVSALAENPSTPSTVRDAARLWLASTGKDHAQIIRDHLLEGKKVGVESDSIAGPANRPGIGRS